MVAFAIESPKSEIEIGILSGRCGDEIEISAATGFPGDEGESIEVQKRGCYAVTKLQEPSPAVEMRST